MNERKSNIDRVLRDRLSDAVTGDAGPHLDENQMAAFAERALPRGESEAMLAHLSACAGCREILALSVMEVARPERRISQWAWMGAAAAAAAVGLIAVLTTHPRSGTTAVPPVDAHATAPVEVARNVPPRSSASEVPGSEVFRQASKVKPGRTPVSASSRPSAHESPAPPVQPAPSETLTAQAASPAPPIESPAPAAETLGSPKPSEIEAKAIRISPSPRSPMFQAIPAGNRFAQSQAGARADMDQRGYAAYQTNALWTVDAPRNQVTRSMDNGKTWQPVRIADHVTFEAVATSGATIWAGGADGALYHSADNGANWGRIVITNGLIKLTGTIVGIDAVTPAQARVTTITGEQWVTADAGLHWSKTI